VSAGYINNDGALTDKCIEAHEKAPMKEYTVVASCTISLHTTVKAKTEAEAIEIANCRDIGAIFDQTDAAEEWATSGEIDGTPFEVSVEK